MTTFTNFTEEMTTKKATVKISQKNKFLRDQKLGLGSSQLGIPAKLCTNKPENSFQTTLQYLIAVPYGNTVPPRPFQKFKLPYHIK